MLKSERQNFILKQVNVHNRVLLSDLTRIVEASEDTIRRDLQELSDDGKLIKVHGGALSKSFHSTINATNVYSIEHKKIIAQKAAAFVEDGMFVLTSGGTTIIELAKALPPGLKATFITGSLPAAFEYIHHPAIEVILIGDKVSKNSQITIGGNAIAQIKQVRADICFLGINAIDAENGLTDNDWDVVQLKKAMIASAKKTIALTISEKINTTQQLQVCALSEIDVLVTELSSSSDLLKPYSSSGIKIV
jgi:DeoR/GlpR family transcriptional regulator of sugar metabolism